MVAFTIAALSSLLIAGASAAPYDPYKPEYNKPDYKPEYKPEYNNAEYSAPKETWVPTPAMTTEYYKPTAAAHYNEYPPAATHTVVAGPYGELRYEQDNIVAKVGDIVEFHFGPANHSVAISSFDKPCEPIFDGYKQVSTFSGFQFPVKEGFSDKVFQIKVEDDIPIWFYCAQGKHCSAGMVGVINERPGPKSLVAYKAAAKYKDATVIPPYVQGGEVLYKPYNY